MSYPRVTIRWVVLIFNFQWVPSSGKNWGFIILDDYWLLKNNPYIVNMSSSSSVEKVEWVYRLLPVLTSWSLNYCALQISDSISKILYKSSRFTYLLPCMHQTRIIGPWISDVFEPRPTHGPNIGRLVDRAWWLYWGDQRTASATVRCKIMLHFYGRFCSFCCGPEVRLPFALVQLSCRGGSVVVGMIMSFSFQSCTMLNHGASFWGMHDCLKKKRKEKKRKNVRIWVEIFFRICLYFFSQLAFFFFSFTFQICYAEVGVFSCMYWYFMMLLLF
jgi:hypothetical protein